MREAVVFEDLKEEEIVNKVGGRFKLSTLIQKRMVALNTGARPLVDSRTNDRMQIVLQEILEDKIYLDTSGELREREQQLPPAERKQLAESILQELAANPEIAPPPRRRLWQEIRGSVPYGLLGADAQEWVSRSRRESDERHRGELAL